MIKPYTHQEALAQFPVDYELGEDTITIYPLTLRSVIDVNQKVRSEFIRSLEDITLTGQELIDYNAQLYKISESMTFETGKGREFFISNPKLLVYFVRHLNRFSEEWSDSRLTSLLFPYGTVNESALLLVMEMKMAVTRKLPEMPTLNIQYKPPKYRATQEETEARIYKSFAEKFGWTYKDILELTEYQVFWYSYLYPEEREHIEEMDALSHKNDNGFNNSSLPISTNPNVKQITDPEEIRLWMEQHRPKQK